MVNSFCLTYALGCVVYWALYKFFPEYKSRDVTLGWEQLANEADARERADAAISHVEEATSQASDEEKATTEDKGDVSTYVAAVGRN